MQSQDQAKPCRRRLSVSPPADIFHSNAAHIWSIKNDNPRFERNPLFSLQRSRMAALRNYLAVQTQEEVCPIALHHVLSLAWHGYVFLWLPWPAEIPKKREGQAWKRNDIGRLMQRCAAAITIPVTNAMQENNTRFVSVGETVGITFFGCAKCWSEWQDLNLRPPRPERGALPDCATLRLTRAGDIYRQLLHFQARGSFGRFSISMPFDAVCSRFGHAIRSRSGPGERLSNALRAAPRCSGW